MPLLTGNPAKHVLEEQTDVAKGSVKLQRAKDICLSKALSGEMPYTKHDAKAHNHDNCAWTKISPFISAGCDSQHRTFICEKKYRDAMESKLKIGRFRSVLNDGGPGKFYCL